MDELTNEDLRLVIRHGSGVFVRAVAAVRLARREDRLDELRELVEDDEEVST